jgi:hypothetical protein
MSYVPCPAGRRTRRYPLIGHGEHIMYDKLLA